MRSLLLVIASFAVTILCWGAYGPVLHLGQTGMVTEAGHAAGEHYARMRPFVCVGLAYFLIGVIVPAILLKVNGEEGRWTATGAIYSLIGGAVGAIGALGIIMAFNFGGKPVYVMPLVFGGAPVVNSFLTIYMAGKLKEIGPLFQAGLIMVLMGAVTVMTQAPQKPKPQKEAPAAVQQDAAASADAAPVVETKQAGNPFSRFVLQILSIVTAVLCWGSYGPVLHKGQAAMGHSRLRPLLCVGVAYFAIAVLVPNLILAVSPENSHYNFSGSLWSLAAGAAGAVGAIGIILAFNFGGKPVYVMPLIFGGAPVVSTLLATWLSGLAGQIGPLSLAGLMLVIAGAAIVLVFAPRGAPPKKAAAPPVAPPPEPPEISDAESEAIEQRTREALGGSDS